MLARFLAACGYSSPDDLVDFLMTGVAVAPTVVFLGAGFGEAIAVMIACLVPALLVLPWLHARDSVKRRQEMERLASVRRLTGQDSD